MLRRIKSDRILLLSAIPLMYHSQEVFIMNPAEAKAIANMLIEGLEREYETTRKVVAAVPDKQLDFKLGDKGRTTRELTWHLIASEAWFANGIANGDFSQAETPIPPNAKVAD